MISLTKQEKADLDEALSASGLRSTKQREHIYGVILRKRDHPTADELFARAKELMPTISLATVYNCLETLIEAHLVRQVNFERGPSRYCPNQTEHAHFHCRVTGRIYDVAIPPTLASSLKGILPDGLEPEHIELSFSGRSETETTA